MTNRMSRGSSGGGGSSSGSGSGSKDGSSGGNSDMAFVSAKVSSFDGSKRTLQESIVVMDKGIDTSSVTGKKGSGIGSGERNGKGGGKESGKKSTSSQAVSSMDVEQESDDDDDDDDDDDNDNDCKHVQKHTKATTTTTTTASTTRLGEIHDTIGDLRLELWRGDSEDGNGARSSSYFDRLWERGQKKRRWFIVLRKL